MSIMFGTEGADLLERQYRVLYWEVNELQIIGNEACMERANRIQATMDRISETLGYTPEA